MSAPWTEWWGDEVRPRRARPLESPDSVGVCAECDLDTPAGERHCGHECPLSICEARARSRFGPAAKVVYPRIIRYDTERI